MAGACLCHVESPVMVSHPEVGLSATADPQAAAADPWDVVIVGAGPAGSATATQVAKHGLRVLLLDREHLPRPKVCGCCLSPLALSELDNLSNQNIRTSAVTHSAPSELNGSFSRTRRLCAIRNRSGVLSRINLDTQLAHHAVLARTAWLPNTRALYWKDENECVALTVQTNNETPYRIQTRRLVLAAGLHDAVRYDNSHSAERPAAKTTAKQSHWARCHACQLQEDHWDPSTSLWQSERAVTVDLVRLEDNTIDVAAAMHPSVLRQTETPAKALSHLLAEAFHGTTCPIDLCLPQRHAYSCHPSTHSPDRAHRS